MAEPQGPRINDREARQLIQIHLLRSGGHITPEQFSVDGMLGQGVYQDLERHINQMTPEQRQSLAIQMMDQMGPEMARQIAPQSYNSLTQARNQGAAAAAVVHSPPEVPQVLGSQDVLRDVKQQVEEASLGYQQSPRTMQDLLSLNDNINAIYSSAMMGVGDPQSDPTAQLLAAAYKIDSDSVNTRIGLASKEGTQASENAIRAVGNQMTYDIGLRNAAIAQARLASDNYFNSRQMDLAVDKLLLDKDRFGLEIRGQDWKEFADVVKLAWEDYRFQVSTQFDSAKLLESVSQFETNRQDTARGIIANLKAGLAKMISDNGYKIAQVSLQAGEQFLQMLPNIITPEMQGQALPGFQSGGPMDYMAKAAGYNYQPITYGDTMRSQNGFDPFAPVQQLRGDMARSESMYPSPSMNDLAPQGYSPATDMLNAGLGNYEPSPFMSGFMNATQSPSEWLMRED